MEDGRWTPTDGYGFHVQLADAWAAHGCQVDTLPPWVPQQSEIRVLKLHGSFGWRVQDDFGPKIVEQGHIFLDHGQFLGSMCFQNHEEICCVRDRAEPEFYNPSNGPVFVVPSYLKQLTGVSMQHVWYEAHQALMHATRVDVLGAGLPASDVAIRALLNPLRFRAEKKQVQVAIHDPSRASRGRWTRFIGPSVIEYARCAGDPR